MYNTPLAYFLTFTVRGSWRHNDSRGSWKRNGRFIPPRSYVRSQPNRIPPHFFSEEERTVIENALVEQCQIKQWRLYEKTVCRNHVHIVLAASEFPPETVMKMLKSKATFRLRKSGFVREDEKIWTQHGSTRYLFDDQSLEAACRYVRGHNIIDKSDSQ